MHARITLATIAAVGLTGLLAACGGSSGSTAAGTGAPSSAPAAATTLTVTVGGSAEFAMSPHLDAVKAGRITVDVTNEGKAVHEVVIVKADDLAAITKSDGTADEAAAVGEVAEIEPGATKSATVDLAPGTYQLVCNEPGHFAGGMVHAITVV